MIAAARYMKWRVCPSLDQSVCNQAVPAQDTQKGAAQGLQSHREAVLRHLNVTNRGDSDPAINRRIWYPCQDRDGRIDQCAP